MPQVGPCPYFPRFGKVVARREQMHAQVPAEPANPPALLPDASIVRYALEACCLFSYKPSAAHHEHFPFLANASHHAAQDGRRGRPGSGGRRRASGLGPHLSRHPRPAPDGPGHCRARSSHQRTGAPCPLRIRRQARGYAVGHLGQVPPACMALARAVGHESGPDPQPQPHLSGPAPLAGNRQRPRPSAHRPHAQPRQQQWSPLSAGAGRVAGRHGHPHRAAAAHRALPVGTADPAGRHASQRPAHRRPAGKPRTHEQGRPGLCARPRRPPPRRPRQR